jgi:cytochrome c oxidase subunit 4
MVSFLMLGSLILGLVSWILPVLSITKDNKNWATYSIISMSSCSIALVFQIFYSNLMVNIGDIAALMDTSGTSALLSVILLVITLILNILSLIYNTIKERNPGD